MLKSTHRILEQKRKYFESVIKKNKFSSRPEQIKKQKMEQSLAGAQLIAPYLRSYAFIEDYDISSELVTFGCTITFKKGQEIKEITILGECDLKFNPKYRSKEGYVAYGSDESFKYVGKKRGQFIEGWKITLINRFQE